MYYMYIYIYTRILYTNIIETKYKVPTKAVISQSL